MLIQDAKLTIGYGAQGPQPAASPGPGKSRQNRGHPGPATPQQNQIVPYPGSPQVSLSFLQLIVILALLLEIIANSSIHRA